MESKIKRIGVLTSGGDAPGMNAAIRAVARTAAHYGIECVGVRRGYHGLIQGDVRPMKFEDSSDLSRRGGTVLYTARSEEFRTEEGQLKAVNNCKMFGLDSIIAIGGDARSVGYRRSVTGALLSLAFPAPLITTSHARTTPLVTTPPVTPLWTLLTDCGTP